MKTPFQKRKTTKLLNVIFGILTLLLFAGMVIVTSVFTKEKTSRIESALSEERVNTLLQSKEQFTAAPTAEYSPFSTTKLLYSQDGNFFRIRGEKTSESFYKRSFVGLVNGNNLILLYSSNSLGDRYELWDVNGLKQYMGASNTANMAVTAVLFPSFLLFLITLIRRIVFRARYGKFSEHTPESVGFPAGKGTSADSIAVEENTEAIENTAAPAESVRKEPKPIEQAPQKEPAADPGSSAPNKFKDSTPAAEDKTEKKHKESIEQITMKQIAENDPDWKVRKTAWHWLGNNEAAAVLTYQNDTDIDNRRKAVQYIHDQDIVTEIILKDEDPKTRAKALKNVEDAAILENVAEQDPELEVRQAAYQVLRRRKMLTIHQLVKNAPDREIREEVLFEWARKNENDYDEISSTLNELIEQTDDQETLCDIALLTLIIKSDYDEYGYQRKQCIERITDKKLLMELLGEEYFVPSIEKMIGRIGDTEQLIHCAKYNKNRWVREEAVRKLQKVEDLAEVVLNINPKYHDSPDMALKRIEDQDVLYKLFTQIESIFLKKDIVRKITDTSYLEKIINTDDEKEIQVIVDNKLKDLGEEPSEDPENEDNKNNQKETMPKKAQAEEAPPPEAPLHPIFLEHMHDETESRDITSNSMLQQLTEYGVQNFAMATRVLQPIREIRKENPDFDLPLIWEISCNFKMDNYKEVEKLIRQFLPGLKRKTEVAACFAPDLFNWALDQDKVLTAVQQKALIAASISAVTGGSEMYFGQLFLAEFLKRKNLGNDSLIRKLETTKDNTSFYGDYLTEVVKLIRTINVDEEILQMISLLKLN